MRGCIHTVYIYRDCPVVLVKHLMHTQSLLKSVLAWLAPTCTQLSKAESSQFLDAKQNCGWLTHCRQEVTNSQREEIKSWRISTNSEGSSSACCERESSRNSTSKAISKLGKFGYKQLLPAPWATISTAFASRRRLSYPVHLWTVSSLASVALAVRLKHVLYIDHQPFGCFDRSCSWNEAGYTSYSFLSNFCLVLSKVSVRSLGWCWQRSEPCHQPSLGIAWGEGGQKKHAKVSENIDWKKLKETLQRVSKRCKKWVVQHTASNAEVIREGQGGGASPAESKPKKESKESKSKKTSKDVPRPARRLQ